MREAEKTRYIVALIMQVVQAKAKEFYLSQRPFIHFVGHNPAHKEQYFSQGVTEKCFFLLSGKQLGFQNIRLKGIQSTPENDARMCFGYQLIGPQMALVFVFYTIFSK
jgi:hypothetical protein